eukprot:scaffold29_cov251-Pinguiococcus_pyrenoidosus.AAC.27
MLLRRVEERVCPRDSTASASPVQSAASLECRMDVTTAGKVSLQMNSSVADKLVDASAVPTIAARIRSRSSLAPHNCCESDWQRVSSCTLRSLERAASAELEIAQIAVPNTLSANLAQSPASSCVQDLEACSLSNQACTTPMGKLPGPRRTRVPSTRWLFSAGLGIDRSMPGSHSMVAASIRAPARSSLGQCAGTGLLQSSCPMTKVRKPPTAPRLRRELRQLLHTSRTIFPSTRTRSVPSQRRGRCARNDYASPERCPFRRVSSSAQARNWIRARCQKSSRLPLQKPDRPFQPQGALPFFQGDLGGDRHEPQQKGGSLRGSLVRIIHALAIHLRGSVPVGCSPQVRPHGIKNHVSAAAEEEPKPGVLGCLHWADLAAAHFGRHRPPTIHFSRVQACWRSGASGSGA